MKTLNDYMEMPYRMEIIEDKEEGGFVAFYPDLPGCITCGETVEIAVANALDAKKACCIRYESYQQCCRYYKLRSFRTRNTSTRF